MKMKVLMTILVLLMTNNIEATLVLNDGQVHNIDYTVSEGIKVRNNFWNEPTTVNIVKPASSVYGVSVYDTSILNISYGYAMGSIRAYDDSQISISGGEFSSLSTCGASHATISGGSMDSGYFAAHSQVYITGGTIDGWLSASGSSQVDICGGAVAGELRLDGHSITTLHGSSFMIDGHPVLGGFTPGGGPQMLGTLSGILNDGTSFSNDFVLQQHAYLSLVPEPATLLLLGIGSLFLLRSKKGGEKKK